MSSTPIPALLSTPEVTFTPDKMVTFTSKMVKKFDDQSSIINDLGSVILGLQNNMSSMAAKMQHLQSDNNSLKEKIQHLESDNMNLRSKVDSTQKHELDKNYVVTKFHELSGKVISLEERLSSFNFNKDSTDSVKI